MTHAWQSALDRGRAARALFVDFKKEFDSVNHNLLLRKLYSRNVPPLPYQMVLFLFGEQDAACAYWNKPFQLATA